MNKEIKKRLLSRSRYLSDEKKYWLNKLSGKLSKTYFPYDFVKPETAGAKQYFIKEQISGELFAKIKHISNNSDKRIFIIVGTAISILLNIYTRADDIILSMPMPYQETEE